MALCDANDGVANSQSFEQPICGSEELVTEVHICLHVHVHYSMLVHVHIHMHCWYTDKYNALQLYMPL